MNMWPAMVSSRLLIFSPAIFMLIAVVIGQPAFDLNSLCSSGESDCTAKRTSDACFQHHLRRSSLSSYSNGSPRIHLRLPHSNGSNIVDLFTWNTPFCETEARFTMVPKTPGKNRISWRSLPRAAAAPGKERNSTSRYVVFTVAVLLTVTFVLLIIASTGIYIRAKMARKNVGGVVTGTMPGEGNGELLTMRSPVSMAPSQPKKNKDRGSFLFACFACRTESMTIGSQHKVSQATGTSQYSSKLQEALDKFDTGYNDSQPVSHFYCFDGYLEKFLRFTIPREGVPLLEKLRSHYGDFTAECRLGNMAGSMLLKLLSAVLLDIRRVPLKDLDITRVCEWRDALKEVLAAGFDVRFLLGHIRHMIVEFHNSPSEQELAELEATIKKKEAELLELRSRKDRLTAACSSSGVGSCFDHILI